MRESRQLTDAPPADRPREPDVGGPRRARGLVAWLSAEEVQRLSGHGADALAVQRARNGLRRRAGEPDQSGLIAPWPASLGAYAELLLASEAGRAMVAEGWELGVVTDLRRVVAAQPTVFVDSGEAEVVALDANDPEAVARLALPLSEPSAQVTARFDEATETWVISSRNPNLRISGTFGGEVQPNVLGFGFLVRVRPSFMSVAEVQGRYILRDGYHRAYRLLGAGVLAVPAFVRRFVDEDESPFRTGMLPREVYCGDRPPTLADYHDHRVSDDVWLPPAETVVLVHGAARRASASDPQG